MDKLVDAIRAGVSGPVIASPEEIERYGHDFGRTVRKVPGVVVRACCEQDVVHALRTARTLHVPIGVRGAGHSVRGQSLCDGGILLVHDETRPEVQLLEDNRVEVTCRTRWRDVEAVLNAAGRTMPVLTNFLATSVGGTLSVGGFGARSLLLGAQVDHVERLRLILPDGQAVWCSPAENAELFRFALAGLGQVGVMERVVMRTIPFQPFARMQLNRHDNLCTLLSAVGWMDALAEGPPDHFYAEVRRRRFWTIFGTGHTTVEEAEAGPLPGPLVDMRKDRVHMTARASVFTPADEGYTADDDVPHRVMADYAFDKDRAHAFAEFLHAPEVRERIWLPQLNLVRMLYLRTSTAASRFPFDLRGGSEQPLAYGIGLYYRVDAGDEAGLSRVKAAHAACLDKCITLGGRPYLYGWLALDQAGMRALYGGDYDRMRALRRTLDPEDLLNHGAL